MIDFNYTAPELLPFRIQEVLDMPNEPHRIGGVVYVPEGGGECEWELEHSGTLYDKWRCSECKFLFVEPRCDQGLYGLGAELLPELRTARERRCMMNSALYGLGYRLKYRHDGRYPSEAWERITSHGYDVQTLTFDTIHGGPWTFECYAKRFVLDSECNWTTQERIEFNPASRDFISCTTGKWMSEPAVLTADECMAVSDHIAMLERERKRGRRMEGGAE